MKKIGFISGVVSSLIGSLILIFTSMIKEIMPKYAYLQFQINGGSYTESAYILDFTFANIVAGLLIVAGIIFTLFCFLSERQRNTD